MASDVAGDTRSIGALIRALADEDCDVRQGAASALGATGDYRAVKALVELLEEDDEEDVREEVVWSLGRIRNAKAIQLLRQAASDKSAHVRRAAAEALASIGAEEALTNQLSQ